MTPSPPPMPDWPAGMPDADWVSPDGSVRLHCGDCLDILPKLPDGSLDAIVTDPPYGVQLTNHGGFAWSRQIDGDASTDVGGTVLSAALNRGLCVVAFASPRQAWPGRWRSYLVWDKGPAVGGGGDLATCWKPTWELIQVANNQPLRGPRDSAVIRRYVGPNNYHDHPVQKPLTLMRYLVGKLRERTICDPFMGVGSTAVACVHEHRRFIGIEIHRPYFDIAVKRITEAFEAQALFRPEAVPTQGELYDD